MRHPVEYLAHGIGQQQAEAEVHQPVVHVPLGPEPVLQGEAKRYLGIGVVRPDNVHAHKQRDQGVRQIRQPEVAADDNNDGHEDENEVVLEQPVVGIYGMIGRPSPDGGECGNQKDMISGQF